ncbi:HigA family addiction module antidote protein [Dyella flagellata]
MVFYAQIARRAIGRNANSSTDYPRCRDWPHGTEQGAEQLLVSFHPGEMLPEEFMVPLGLSGNALASALGVTAARINEIVQEKRGITADTALRLSRYFGNSPEFWLNLQQRYELECARRELGETLKEIHPRAA